MRIDGWRKFSSYDDFKEWAKSWAYTEPESKEEQENEYYSALEDLDYFESKKYGKIVGDEDGKMFYPFYGSRLRSLHGSFIINYLFGKIQSIVLSPSVLVEWYERKEL